MAMQIPSWLKPINNVDAYLCEKCGDEVRGHSAEQHVRSHEQVRVEKGRWDLDPVSDACLVAELARRKANHKRSFMVVAGDDKLFENIGASIKVELPNGDGATIGKTPVARCFTDAEWLEEAKRRGLIDERKTRWLQSEIDSYRRSSEELFAVLVKHSSDPGEGQCIAIAPWIDEKLSKLRELQAIGYSADGMSAKYWKDCSDDFQKRWEGAEKFRDSQGEKLEGQRVRIKELEDELRVLKLQTRRSEAPSAIVVPACLEIDVPRLRSDGRVFVAMDTPENLMHVLETGLLPGQEDITRGIAKLDLRPDTSVSHLLEDLVAADE